LISGGSPSGLAGQPGARRPPTGGPQLRGKRWTNRQNREVPGYSARPSSFFISAKVVSVETRLVRWKSVPRLTFVCSALVSLCLVGDRDECLCKLPGIGASDMKRLRFRRYLGDVMLGGDTEPEMLVDGLFVREKHHLVYGKKESGKTWVLLHAAAELVRRGEPVVWVDEEMGRRDMADRLRWMQLDPEAVSGLFTYLEMPMLNGSRESLALWTALLQVKRPSLVAVDAQTEVLASADLNENSGTDVAKWHAWYLAPALRLGAATVVIDHTGHDGARLRTQGRTVEGRAERQA
jgi:hypothetical protein